MVTAEKSMIVRTRELLVQVQDACNDFALHSLDKTLISINNFAAQNQYLDVAVLGQFKAGKSSFLNAYLDNMVLIEPSFRGVRTTCPEIMIQPSGD